MKKWLWVGVALALYGGVPAWAAEVDAPDAYELYEKKQFKAAYRLWYPQALKGDSVAQYAVGVMLMYGQDIKPDRVAALKWLHKAAAQGEEQAMQQLMWLYSDGKYVAEDKAQARRWAEKLEAQGDDLGVKFLANADSESNDLDTLNRAIERFETFITPEPDLYFEQYRLGMAYAYRAKFIPSDTELARRWFKISEKNSPPEFVRFPRMGESFFIDEQDKATADEAYQRMLSEAEQGQAQAQYLLARHLEYKKQDYVGAYDWLKKAAAQQHPDALNTLGEAHESAMYCLRNIAEGRQPNPRFGAVRTDGQPAEEWNELQCPKSGLLKENVLPMNASQLLAQEQAESLAASKYFAQATALNQPDALYHSFEETLDGSGSCVWGGNIKSDCEHIKKNGVSEQNKKAFAYLLKAAELGNTRAFADLGAHYLAGDIVPKSLSESLRWYQKSADDGTRAGANLYVAQFYCKGMGVPKDDDLCRYHLLQGYESVEDEIDLYAKEMGLMPYVRKFVKQLKK